MKMQNPLKSRKLPHLRQSKLSQSGVLNNFGTSFALFLCSLSEKRIFKHETTL